MTDCPSHEDVETYVGSIPRGLIDRLPDSPEKWEARTHVDDAERLVHKLVEAVESHPEPAPAPAFEVC